MACVNPDGTLSERAASVLKALLENPGLTDQDIANIADRPLFQVRSSLRELKNAGLIEEKEGKYYITDKGKEALRKTLQRT